MNYMIAEHIDTIISDDKRDMKLELIKLDLLEADREVDKNKTNEIVRLSFPPLLIKMREEDISIAKNYEYLRAQYESGNIMVCYYHILLMLYSIEASLPKAFISLTSNDKVLDAYIFEVLLEMEEFLDE